MAFPAVNQNGQTTVALDNTGSCPAGYASVAKGCCLVLAMGNGKTRKRVSPHQAEFACYQGVKTSRATGSWSQAAADAPSDSATLLQYLLSGPQLLANVPAMQQIMCSTVQAQSRATLLDVMLIGMAQLEKMGRD